MEKNSLKQLIFLKNTLLSLDVL